MTILPSKREKCMYHSQNNTTKMEGKLEGGPGTTGFTVGDGGGGGGGGGG